MTANLRKYSNCSLVYLGICIVTTSVFLFFSEVSYLNPVAIIKIMDVDYEKLGFKAGVEIHQELNTKKLFCSCKTTLKEQDLKSKTIRKLRSVAGETGEVDLASSYEHLRDREFIYSSYAEESCLVDLDEEPPHDVNPEAFNLALGVSKMFRLKIPDTICVMRKTVTDGSAVSGFQRTMMVGYESKDSFLETKSGKVKINQLNLEEDSCKIEKNDGNKVYYSLSRLGVPLLEVGTDATIKNPEHVKEVALEIGTMLRSFNVKRGIGTIRQDVNISIKDGARVEVKGWQDLRKLPELVINEVSRQSNLIEIKKELTNRGLKKFDKKSKDVTELFKNSQSKIITDLISSGGKVYSLILPKFSGLLKMEICPGRTFGKELSEYAKAYGTKGMIHTDEDLSKYRLEAEFSTLKEMNDDLVIIIAEKEEVAKKAVDAVYERALYCLVGVPEETRIPNHADTTSSYARPLPGAHRMYPETDVSNIEITKEMIKSITVPELIKEKIVRFSKNYKLQKELSTELIREGYDFEMYVKKFKNVEPSFIARFLIEMPKEIMTKYKKEIDASNYLEIIEKFNSAEISKDAVFEILMEISQGKSIDYKKYKQLTESELNTEIEKIINENKGLPLNALVGKVMSKLRGKADGEKIIKLINEDTKNML